MPPLITAKSSARVSDGRKGRMAIAISLWPTKIVATAAKLSIREVPRQRRSPSPISRVRSCMTRQW